MMGFKQLLTTKNFHSVGHELNIFDDVHPKALVNHKDLTQKYSLVV